MAIDFDQVCTQAPIDIDVFLQPPPGFNLDKDYVLKLKKTTYGLKQGGYNFWVKLRDFLTPKEMGFINPAFDPCAFIKEGMIVLSCVNDCLVFAQNKTLTQNFNTSLKEEFKFNEEGPVSTCLGVEIKATMIGIKDH